MTDSAARGDAPATSDAIAAPAMERRSYAIGDAATMQALLGERDRHLRWLESRLGVRLAVRDGSLRAEGENGALERLGGLLVDVLDRIAKGREIDTDVLRRLVDRDEPAVAPPRALSPLPGRRAELARTSNQRRYVEAIGRSDVVFGCGPAGTGKTFLAVAMALDALERHLVKRIVLTRPAVEAGEKLGFLPGDLSAKVNPYLRPLLDALGDLLDAERVERLVERGRVEVAPLAFMRGRTLASSFIILDEAQNCTPEQMAMLLTRLGQDSKVVVTGDPSQSDLPFHQRSGLRHALEILDNVQGIDIVRFGPEDVVRHPMVARIAAAYARDADARRDAPDGHLDERPRLRSRGAAHG